MEQYVKRIRTEDGDLQIDYNALANLPETDTTLTKSGQAADAKAVGDALVQQTNAVNIALAEQKKEVEDALAQQTNTVEDALKECSDDVKAVEDALKQKANVTHKHSTSDITSGILPISRGGTGASTLDGLFSNFGGSNQNLLDNWYFTDPVNQRGRLPLAPLGEEGYIIDRWLFSIWSSVNPHVYYQSNYGLVLKCEAEKGDTNSTYIKQTVENPARFAGKTVTLSAKLRYAKVDGDPVLLIYSEGASKASATHKIINEDSGRTISVTTTLANDITRLYVGIGNFSNNGGDGNFTLGIESMKLEIGSASTLNNDAPPNKLEQLLKCQRYYVKFPGFNAFPGYKNSEKVPYAFAQLPVPLRKLNEGETISVKFSEELGFLLNASGTVYSIDNSSGIEAGYQGGNNFRLILDDSSQSTKCPMNNGYNFICQDLEISVEI